MFLAAREAAESVGRAVSDRYDLPDAVGGWLQEFAVGVQQDRDTAVKEQAGGFGFAGGAETANAGFGHIGVTAAFTDADIKDPDLHTASRTTFDELEAGLYWRDNFGGLQLTARGGGGYLFGRDQRYVDIAATDATTAVAQVTRASWHGYTEDARGGAAYQFDFGKFFLRPQVSGEYFRLKQNAYDESGAESEGQPGGGFARRPLRLGRRQPRAGRAARRRHRVAADLGDRRARRVQRRRRPDHRALRLRRLPVHSWWPTRSPARAVCSPWASRWAARSTRCSSTRTAKNTRTTSEGDVRAGVKVLF